MFGAIGGALGGISSAIAGIYSANKSAKSAKHAMETQINWNKYLLENQHQLEAEDLEKAGINPILAHSQGAGIGISGQTADTSGIQAGAAGLTQGLTNAAEYILKQQGTENDTMRARTQSALNEAETLKKLKEANVIDKTGIKEAESRIKQNLSSANKLETDTAISKPKAQLTEMTSNLIEDGKNVFNRMRSKLRTSANKLIDNVDNR